MGSLEPLRGYQGEDIEIQLPGNLTVYDIDWLAVWCVQYRHNFGHVFIPKNLDVPPALGQTKIAVSLTFFRYFYYFQIILIFISFHFTYLYFIYRYFIIFSKFFFYKFINFFHFNIKLLYFIFKAALVVSSSKYIYNKSIIPLIII